MTAEEPNGRKRHAHKDPESPAAEGAGKRRKGGLKARVAELEQALEKAAAEAAESYNRWLRSRAEYENLKKRTIREIEQAHQSAGRSLVASLLPVLDDLEKAVEASRESEALRSMKEGLALIHKGLLDALKGAGVRAMDPLGQTFDPNVHEAVMQAPCAHAEPGAVIQVLQNGYEMNGITLRAAKVIVAGQARPTHKGESAPQESAAEAGGDPARPVRARGGGPRPGHGKAQAGEGSAPDDAKRSGAGDGAGSPGDEV